MKAKYMVGKVNMFDLTSNEGFRTTDNVFHEDGYKVATDGLILLAIQDVYDNDIEGKCLTKEGKIIEARYPNWRGVIPCLQNDFKMDEWIAVHANLEDVEEWVKHNRKVFKDADGKGKMWDKCWEVYAGSRYYFTAQYYIMFAKALKELGTDVFYIHKEMLKPAFAESDNGYALMMSLFHTTEGMQDSIEDGNTDIYFLSND